MKSKYVRDSKSAEIIEIIRNGMTTDIALIYPNAFNGLGYTARYMTNTEQPNLQAFYDSRKTAAETAMQDLIAQFTQTEN